MQTATLADRNRVSYDTLTYNFFFIFRGAQYFKKLDIETIELSESLQLMTAKPCHMTRFWKGRNLKKFDAEIVVFSESQ